MLKGEKPVPMKSKRSETLSGSPRGITISEINVKGREACPDEVEAKRDTIGKPQRDLN
jgi:hypothetical protein